VREPEIAEGALLQGLSVLTSARQPGGDGGLPIAEDTFSMAMCTISNQGVNVSIGDTKLRTLSVRTGEALCVHPLRCSPAAFHLTPGAHRQRRWLHNR
jgi:hypothetical protein